MRLNINDIDTFYNDGGSGQSVVLLHGWGVDSSTLEPLRRHLSDYCRAVSLDLPGHGKTPPPAAAWSVYDYAAFVRAFIAALGLDRPLIFGHSFGGRLGIILGAEDCCDKLILCDAAGIIPKRGLGYYARVYSYKAAKRLMSLPLLRGGYDQVMRLWLKSNPSSDYAAAEGVMRQIFVKVVNEDLSGLLPRIKASTLLLWGENDTATPLCDGRLMEKSIPDAGLVIFEDCGHYPFLEQPRRFELILDSFIGAPAAGEEQA
ncbi:MAG: alpha/beta hydrolase [Bacillota bacterium]|nr:alpha/beta hydrolase [Bacillota bacterium]